MIQKPPRFASAHAEAFKDLIVADAYRYRLPYPTEGFDILAELVSGEPLVRRDLFRKVGEKKSVSVPFEQSIDDFIESYHSRAGFSRERMGSARSRA